MMCWLVKDDIKGFSSSSKVASDTDTGFGGLGGGAKNCVWLARPLVGSGLLLMSGKAFNISSPMPLREPQRKQNSSLLSSKPPFFLTLALLYVLIHTKPFQVLGLPEQILRVHKAIIYSLTRSLLSLPLFPSFLFESSVYRSFTSRPCAFSALEFRALTRRAVSAIVSNFAYVVDSQESQSLIRYGRTLC